MVVVGSRIGLLWVTTLTLCLRCLARGWVSYLGPFSAMHANCHRLFLGTPAWGVRVWAKFRAGTLKGTPKLSLP